MRRRILAQGRRRNTYCTVVERPVISGTTHVGQTLTATAVSGWGGACSPLPTNTLAPTLSGDINQGSTLTVTPGTWEGTILSTTYQWRRDGVAIDGATGTTYVLQAADVEAMIDCVETVANGGGSVSVDTNDLGPVVEAVTAITYSTTNKDANISLTNSDRTVSAAGVGCGQSDFVLVGKSYHEVVIDNNATITDGYFGLTMSPYVPFEALGFTAGLAQKAVGYRENGTIWHDGVQRSTAHPAHGTGSVIQIAFDNDTKRVWFGHNGVWVGDPAASIGGYTLFSADYSPAYTLRDNLDQITGRFKAMDQAYAAPAGFAAVDGYAITANPVTSARNGVAYDGFTATAWGGTAPYVYSLVGTWPAGLTIDSATGAVSGTPTVDGTYAGLSVRVTDAGGQTADLPTFSIVVALAGTVWSSVNKAATITLTNNDATATATDGYGSGNSDEILTGKSYIEILVNTDGSASDIYLGLAAANVDTLDTLGFSNKSYDNIAYREGGTMYRNGSSLTTKASYTTGDVIGIAWDNDTNSCWFSKNGVWQLGDPAAGTGAFILSAGAWRAAYTLRGTNDQITIRGKAADQSYAPPTGFSAPDG